MNSNVHLKRQKENSPRKQDVFKATTIQIRGYLPVVNFFMLKKGFVTAFKPPHLFHC